MGHKKLIIVTALGTLLFWNNLAFAIAIYDYTTSVTLSFNQPWSSVSSGIPPTEVNTSGTGLHTEATSLLQTSDLTNFLFSQTVSAVGSAGDALFITSGQSVVDNSVYTRLTFDFGSTPTDFSMMYAVMDFNLNQSKQLPFEPSTNSGETFLSGSGGTQLALDGGFGPRYTVGQPKYFYGLTGTHTVRLWTGVEINAVAIYPYVAPEPSTLLLELIGFCAIIASTLIRRWAIDDRSRPGI